jgi:hypothetical protein
MVGKRLKIKDYLFIFSMNIYILINILKIKCTIHIQ